MQIADIHKAYQLQKQCKTIFFKTECQKSISLSEKYNCNLFLKREDTLPTRIFKIRGIYNKMMNLTEEQKQKGVVCASDGNLAQALAYLCNDLQIRGTIFIPAVCYDWKQDLIRTFGKEWITLVVQGENYEVAENAAIEFQKQNNSLNIHSYDDDEVLAGNGTIAIEILEVMQQGVDILIIPIGRGSLAAAITIYFKSVSPQTKIIGVEPLEAAAMTKAFEQNKIVKLEKISRFCDGSSVSWASNIGFEVCSKHLSELIMVPEGKISTTILQLYQLGIPVEPAGALAVACLDQIAKLIIGKTVVCVITGGTVDLQRFDQFKEISLIYEGLKFIIIVDLPNKPGVIRDFANKCLAPTDDITNIQYRKKINKECVPALISIECQSIEDVLKIKERMNELNFQFRVIDESCEIYDLIT